MPLTVGDRLGDKVGDIDGVIVGNTVGMPVSAVGASVGSIVGSIVGKNVLHLQGSCVIWAQGMSAISYHQHQYKNSAKEFSRTHGSSPRVGDIVGSMVGIPVSAVGATVGSMVGIPVSAVGATVGRNVGTVVGSIVGNKVLDGRD